jgi:hypothetical protein
LATDVGPLIRHHVKPGSDDPADSLALCASCHAEVDPVTRENANPVTAYPFATLQTAP